MTIPEALIVAASSNRQLHALGYQNCDGAREEALEVLALELERVSRVAGDYIGTDPENITHGCVDALVFHAKQLQAEVEGLRAVPCACACHSVAGHADEPTMGMMLSDALQEIDRLCKHLASVAPLLGEYTMSEFIPVDPTSPLGAACVQFGPVTPPAPRGQVATQNCGSGGGSLEPGRVGPL